MGRGRRPHVKKDKKDTKKVDTWQSHTTVLENEKFEAYYKAQGLIPESEWDEFMSSLKESLPTTFRVTGSRSTAFEMNNIIKDTYVPFLSGIVFEGQPLEPPSQLPWYPDGLAWQLNIKKQAIRRSPEFKKFQNFLVYETEAGNLSRQEAVSMIPPLLLDVEGHHNVLDCCAAPGSKSVQILEAVHAGGESVTPTGLFIANDSDSKRCQMLVHQSLGRVGSPNMMVTNQDASALPNIYTRDPHTNARQQLLFDRILADVPCTGDGTMRKNIPIWGSWTVNNGIGLHSLQLRILKRCIAILKPGGRLVYSTCSLNPIENEAVVSAALSACPDMSLVDVSDRLPQLKRRPGVSSWKVIDNEGKEVTADEQTDQKKMPSTLWPSEEASTQNLDRCLRLYPHLQNTGGFFVSVLTKAGGDEEQSDKEQPPAKRQKVQESDRVDASTSKDEGGNYSFKEDPYTYLSPDEEQIKACIDHFKLKPDFDVSNLLVRNKEGKALRTVYATSPSVRCIVTENDYRRIRLVSCGVKVFSRQDSGKGGYECRWRASSEGLNVLRPYIGEEKVVQGSMESLKRLLSEYYPPISSFDEDFQAQLAKQDMGSFIFEVVPETEANQRALSLRIFGEDMVAAGPSPKKEVAAPAQGDSEDVSGASPLAKEASEKEAVAPAPGSPSLSASITISA